MINLEISPNWGEIFSNYWWSECISQRIYVFWNEKLPVVVVTFWFSDPAPHKKFQASPLVLSPSHKLHWVQKRVSRELVSSLGGEWITFGMPCGLVMAMAISYIAWVWCGSRLGHSSRVSAHVWSQVFHACGAFHDGVRYIDNMASENAARC